MFHRSDLHQLVDEIFYIFAYARESLTDSWLLLIQRWLWLVAGLGQHQQR